MKRNPSPTPPRALVPPLPTLLRRALWVGCAVFVVADLYRRDDPAVTAAAKSAPPPLAALRPSLPDDAYPTLPLLRPYSLLRRAAAAGDMDMVERIVQVGGANPDGMDPDASPPQTALAAACGAGRLDVARYLLMRGANPNAGDWKPLMAASRADTNRPALLSLLLSHGADPNVRCTQAAFSGWTPLFFVLAQPNATPLETQTNAYPNAEAMTVLLRHGADSQLRDSRGLTAMDYAHHFAESPNVPAPAKGFDRQP